MNPLIGVCILLGCICVLVLFVIWQNNTISELKHKLAIEKTLNQRIFPHPQQPAIYGSVNPRQQI